eukprot:3909928-Lingulodinium_polyedra.AAC.1
MATVGPIRRRCVSPPPSQGVGHSRVFEKGAVITINSLAAGGVMNLEIVAPDRHCCYRRRVQSSGASRS